jgi:hypothetical protein
VEIRLGKSGEKQRVKGDPERKGYGRALIRAVIHWV